MGGFAIVALALTACTGGEIIGPRPDLAQPPDGGDVPDLLSVDDAGMPIQRPSRYPAGALHSPMSPAVVARLSSVLSATTGQKDVFAKVGDSITVDTNFLDCYAGTDVMLDTESALEPTRTWFNQTAVSASNTSFDRTTLSAAVGWSAGSAIAGSPTPIEQEVSAINPAFAVVMFGTNDTSAIGFWTFEKSLRGVVDQLLGLGVVPLLSTIPPRSDSTTMNALVPEMNAIIRAVAQYRQIPYMDYWQTLNTLPAYGLAGDGIHPQVYSGPHGCWLTPPALQYGCNQRNRVTLESLDRVRRFLVAGTAAEAAPHGLAGTGTFADPRQIDALPFVDDGDTTKSTSKQANVYNCAAQDESGPEIVYTLTLTTAATVRARVYVDNNVDVDLHWLTQPDATHCTARNDKTLEVVAQPGTYYISVDSFVSGGVAKSGGYRLTVVSL